MIEDQYDLSPLQQGMLFHHLSGEDPGVDVEQIVIDLREPVKVPALRDAWQYVLDRHAVLRTALVWHAVDVPLQQVHRDVKIAISYEDWRLQTSIKVEKATTDYLRAERRRGFDLRQPPLMRLAVFQLRDAKFRLICTFHHILMDGRGFTIVLRDVFSFYDGLVKGRRPQCQAPRPYHDYIEWIKKQDQSGAFQFWHDKLRGFTAPTPLVSDLDPDSAAEQDRYGEQETRLSAECTSQLRTMLKKENLTFNTLVQGAWALLLNRYIGQDDIIFGATKTTRHSSIEGADSMVGLFLATLPVRVKVEPEAQIVLWLKRVRQEWISLREYEHTSLVAVKEASSVSPEATLFESLVVYEKEFFGKVLQDQGGPWQNRDFRLLEQPNYPLSLMVCGGPELLLKIDYDSRRFSGSTIARMLDHVRTLLESIAGNPEQTVSTLDILTPAERRRMVVEWNECTQRKYPRASCVPELVEHQVARTPSATAVVFGNNSLTYEELNVRANRLAHYLRELGVGPDVLVGICVERSSDMLVGLLGILKAGGAYVPLDPAYPIERLAYMVEQSKMTVMLTDARLESRLRNCEARVVCLDSDWGRIARHSEENCVVEATPENLAYVIYTSGSTGKPKGVQITHRALVNFLYSMRRLLGMASDDILLAVTTISFDIAALELYLPLIVGAKVIIVDRETAKDAPRLRDALEDSRATVMQATPSTWRMLVEAAWRGSTPLNTVIFGGEALSRDLADQLLQRVPIVWNMYGPTEATVWSTAWQVTRGTGPILIGRPVANTRVYILDRRGQPVPVGVAGELCIGGDGVGRGYLGYADLTEERFLKDHFSCQPGSHFYRTGDLARYRDDGNIEYLGRIDHQIKIRGFRVEPGEIEAVLAEHPDVCQSAVVAREFKPGDTRLFAYVVPEHGIQPSPADLRIFLKERLPDHMVPAGFVILPELPLTPNGKVDRSALPEPTQHSEAQRQFTEPGTDVELMLAAIWQDVLGVERIGMQDNFFDLGGHSLSAMQIAFRIRQVFNIDFPLRSFFEAPVLGAQAQQLQEKLLEQADPRKLEELINEAEEAPSSDG